jgi:biopolymer transport protein ExbD
LGGLAEKERSSLITGINITPLVDVVLVLLIIFMATAPLIHRRTLQVNVPKAKHNEPKATAALQIQYTEAREILLDGKSFTPEDLTRELTLRFRTDPALHVSVAADRALPYGDVVELLDAVRGVGVRKVALEVKSR